MKQTPQPIQHGSAHPLSPDLSIGNPNNAFAQVAEIFKMYLLLLRDRCGRLDLITTGLRRRCVPSIHSGFQIGLQKWKLRVEDLRFVLPYKLLTKILQYVLLRIPDRSQNVGLHPGHCRLTPTYNRWISIVTWTIRTKFFRQFDLTNVQLCHA